MSEQVTGQARMPLGVGTLISSTFSLLFRNFLPMMVIGAIPAALETGIGLVTGSDGSGGIMDRMLGLNPEAVDTGPAGVILELLLMLISLTIWGLATASVVAAAYDAASGRAISFGRAFSTGLSRAFWVVICIVLATLAIGGSFVALAYLGTILGVVIGFFLMLYLASVWFVLVPTIVVEGTGIGSFGRSARLTKSYRWPLLGLLTVFVVITILLSLLLILPVGALAITGVAGQAIEQILSVLVSAFFYGLSGSLAALAYARLVEIKEGTSVERLADIFS